MPRSRSCWSVFDIANKARKIEELEQQASQPDFWNDPAASQAVMKELNDLRGLVEGWQALAQRAHDAADFAEMGDAALEADLAAEATAIQAELDQRELQLMLSGPHDRGNALMSLHA